MDGSWKFIEVSGTTELEIIEKQTADPRHYEIQFWFLFSYIYNCLFIIIWAQLQHCSLFWLQNKKFTFSLMTFTAP